MMMSYPDLQYDSLWLTPLKDRAALLCCAQRVRKLDMDIKLLSEGRLLLPPREVTRAKKHEAHRYPIWLNSA